MKKASVLIVTLAVFALPAASAPNTTLAARLSNIAQSQLSPLIGTGYSLSMGSFLDKNHDAAKEAFQPLEDAVQWDENVQQIFATLAEDKIMQLAEQHGAIEAEDTNIDLQSVKNRLYIYVKNGGANIVDDMVEMGLDLQQVNLQPLLLDALRPGARRSSAWAARLFADGATVDDPQLIEMLFRRAAAGNDVELLERLKGYFAEDATAETFAQWVTASLDTAVLSGMHDAAKWAHGNDASITSTSQEFLLQLTQLSYLEKTGELNLQLAHYASDKNVNLNPVLAEIVDAEIVYGDGRYLNILEHLTRLGAKLTKPELQANLYRSLVNGNWLIATWLITQGVKINALSLGKHLSRLIDAWQEYHRTTSPWRTPTDTAVLLDFLAIHGFARERLNLQKLINRAEAKNVPNIAAQLRDFRDSAPVQISATEILQQLRAELGTEPERVHAIPDSEPDIEHLINTVPYESSVWLSLYLTNEAHIPAYD